MRICSACGEKNEDWMDICQRCGKSIVNAEVDNTDDTSNKFIYDDYEVEEKEEKPKKKIIIANLDLKIILVVLLVILFILFMIVLKLK